MKALLLAAGYGTRLYPLTKDRAKALLPIAERPLLDWIADAVDEVAEVDGLHVVTNARFASAVEHWADERRGRLRPVVHDDGTRTNGTRLGALGDATFAIDRAGLGGDDLLVIAGDNLFTFALSDYVAWWRSRGECSAIAVRDCGSIELARRYAVVDLDRTGRVVSFVEKPQQPAGTVIAIATYIYHREHVPLLALYLAAANPPDEPGRFIAWLHARRPVYGYRFAGSWFDIGDAEELLAADNAYREKAHLPKRTAYVP